MKTQLIKLDKIQPYPGNPRKIPPAAIAKVAKSLQTNGWMQPIVVDSHNVIVVGHTRYQAACYLRDNEGTILEHENMNIAPVIYCPSTMTEAQIKAYRIADNRVGSESSFDFERLALEMTQLNNEFTGFSNEELDRLISSGDKISDVLGRLQERRITKAPVSYYGGKKRLAPIIAEIIEQQEWKKFVEPFAGGAAVMWALDDNPKREYIMNDIHDCVVEFWLHFCDPEKRKELIAEYEKYGIYAEKFFNRARDIFAGKNPDEVKPVEKAWAMLYAANASVMGSFGGFATADSHKGVNLLQRKIKEMKELEVLRRVMVLKKDALYVIEKMCDRDTIIFVDSPYIGSDMGHYSGYSDEDFQNLVRQLAQTPAKFVMTTYDNYIINAAIAENAWNVMKINLDSPAASMGGGIASGGLKTDRTVSSARQEFIICNFPIPEHLTTPAAGEKSNA